MKVSKCYLLLTILAVSFLFITVPFINQPQAADMEFDIIYDLAGVVDNLDGTKTYTINFDIQNMAGESVSNLTIEMISLILLSPETDNLLIGAMGVDEIVTTSGSFTVEDLGLEDDEFIMHLVWLVEYDDSLGVHQTKHIEGFYELFPVE